MYMKFCENCGKEHDESYKTGRFCSEKCSKGFSTKAKRKEINQAVSKKLKKDPPLQICKNCQGSFKSKKKNQQFCSNSCSLKYKWKDPQYKKDMSKMSTNLANKRHLDKDPSFGWQSREKINPSYPESVAINFLESKNINFIREVKEGKYFIDLALPERRIAIEIDGQQHEKRKQSDFNKDLYLISRGWKVFRIKYPEQNIKTEIEKII